MFDRKKMPKIVGSRQDHREFPFWNWKIPPPTKKFPKIPITENE